MIIRFVWFAVFALPQFGSAKRKNGSPFDKQEEFVRLVNAGIENALDYVYPTDASEYRIDPTTCWRDPYSCWRREDHGTYDFIVIGSGAAGSVIANRLTEVAGFSVLLLEAGHFENEFVDIPGMAFYAQGTEYNWGFTSIPQKSSCLGMVEQRCQIQRGKGVGGTTIINGLVYSRGSPKDYDLWNDQGNPGWSYKDVLPYFKKSEANQIFRNDIYHGNNGRMNVEYSKYDSPHITAFLEANEQLGFKEIDYNGEEDLGYSRAQFNTRNGRRLTSGAAFVSPAINRANLVISTGSYVTKILISPITRTAYGVEFVKNNQTFAAYSAKEVILSAGAISSPHILMHSGIGPTNLLRSVGLSSIADLSVGDNLQDHICIFGLSITSNTSLRAVSTEENVENYLKGEGLYTLSGNNAAVGFYKTNFSKYDSADLEFILVAAPRADRFFQKGFGFTQETFYAITSGVDNTNTFTIYIYTLHPDSVGTVAVKSDNPFDYPAIDPKMLDDSNNYDIDTLYDGILQLERLLNTPAMRRINAQFKPTVLPQCKRYKIFTKQYWHCFIKHTSDEIYHPVGTCKMGPDPRRGAVVNNKLKVYGINRLRIADASVIPFSLSGHTSAPSVMIGERASDFIKEEYYAK